MQSRHVFVVQRLNLSGVFAAEKRRYAQCFILPFLCLTQSLCNQYCPSTRPDSQAVA
jgi:hypothetical protein